MAGQVSAIDWPSMPDVCANMYPWLGKCVTWASVCHQLAIDAQRVYQHVPMAGKVCDIDCPSMPNVCANVCFGCSPSDVTADLNG